MADISDFTDWVFAHEPFIIAAAPTESPKQDVYFVWSSEVADKWLRIIGPPAMVMLQHFARKLKAESASQIFRSGLSANLGLDATIGGFRFGVTSMFDCGPESQVVAALARLARFGLVYPHGDVLMVRLWLPSPSGALT